MKALILLTALTISSFAQEKTLDLTRPENYANQPVPAYITKDNTPAGNEITDLGATLGRVLFYDKRLSRNDTISCSSCHHQQNGFSDTATASSGVAGTTGRHSMRLINARFSDEMKFFWDERAASAEVQATQPIQDHVEMGFSGTDGDPDFSDLVTKLSAIEEYQVLFQGVFGEATINEERIGKAIAQFVRSLQSFDSKYDAGRAIRNEGQPFPNFTASENTDGPLGLVILPTDNAQMSFSEQDGTQYVTLRSSGVPNVEYLFQTSPDLDQWSSTSFTASAAGELEIDVPLVEGEDQMFYRFAYGVTAD